MAASSDAFVAVSTISLRLSDFTFIPQLSGQLLLTNSSKEALFDGVFYTATGLIELSIC